MNLYVNIKNRWRKEDKCGYTPLSKNTYLQTRSFKKLICFEKKLKTIFDKYYNNNPKKFIDIIEKNQGKFIQYYNLQYFQ